MDDFRFFSNAKRGLRLNFGTKSLDSVFYGSLMICAVFPYRLRRLAANEVLTRAQVSFVKTSLTLLKHDFNLIKLKSGRETGASEAKKCLILALFWRKPSLSQDQDSGHGASRSVVRPATNTPQGRITTAPGSFVETPRTAHNALKYVFARLTGPRLTGPSVPHPWLKSIPAANLSD